MRRINLDYRSTDTCPLRSSVRQPGRATHDAIHDLLARAHHGSGADHAADKQCPLTHPGVAEHDRVMQDNLLADLNR